MSAVAITETWAREVRGLRIQDERARERIDRRAERAIRLAEGADQHLHGLWRVIDQAKASGLAAAWDAEQISRVEQEEAVATWAWAQANVGQNPALAGDMDIVLLTEVGIDPEPLKIRLAESEGALASTIDAAEHTVLDDDALIDELIRAAHPSTESVHSGTPQSVRQPFEPGEQLNHELTAPDIEPGEA
ncbi:MULTISPECIES: hypothetical protein [unclassified Nocardia]|uniref:hypothetical protein n=1 Tax=unclassified Nocardia TaxID=2637762 RepID=UPI001CE48510|nr:MULTISPECIES: hypothetical protein [unclassified Nocardia]